MNKLIRIIGPVFLFCFYMVCAVGNAGQTLQPVLSLAAAVPHEQVQVQCPLKIWINQTADWELTIDSHDLAVFYRLDNEWYQASAGIKGKAGSGIGEFLNLLFAFEIPWLSPGEYTRPLTIKMPQGSGLVIYPKTEQLWLLALGSNQYCLVDPVGHSYELPVNQWVKFSFSLEQVELYWQKHCIWPEKLENAQIYGLTKQVNRDFSSFSRLMWLQSSFSAATGAVFNVDLKIQAAEDLPYIELQFSEGLIPVFSKWTINDQPIIPHLVNGKYIVAIPDKLAAGSCTLSGTVLAGTSTKNQQSITAVYGKEQAKLTGQVIRGWLGDQGQVIVSVTENSKPAPNHLFFLPDGKTAKTDKNGYLIFTVKPGLHPIISCDNVGIVRWFDVGLNEIRRINIELCETKKSSGFIAWDFNLDSEFNWGLNLHAPNLKIGFNTKEPLELAAKTKTVTFDYQRDGKKSKWELQYQPRKDNRRISYGSCIWTNCGTQWQGLLNRGDLVLTADFETAYKLPRLSGFSIAKLKPYWKICVQNNRLLLETRYRDFFIKLRWQDDKPIDLIVAPIGRSWSLAFDSSSMGIKGILFKSLNQFQWQYQYNFDGCSQMDLSYVNSRQKAVFSIKRQAENVSAGLKTAVVYGSVNEELSVSFAGMYVEKKILAELILHYRLALSKLCHLVVEWQNQYNSNVVTSFWGAGLTIGEKHMTAKIGWNQQSGSYFRLGVSLIEWLKK
ncbi:MAG: hypothetical protein GX994_04365 [Firmicutes bacterium]|nr:hypothetical protein [Bacillota bacterium]